MKVLVVEDDQNVAQSIHELLGLYHYAIDVVADAETGLQMAAAFEYDLALVDIGLPGLDGLELCAQLRQAGQTLPILLLTGQNREGPQKAAALNAGADDYVSKPFDAEELVARVQALLRRGGPQSSPILTWGALSIDPNSRRTTYGTRLLSPTPKEYAILELLLRQAQTTFSAAYILDRVWDSAESPGEEVVRYHIKELRQKLTAAGASKKFIETVHGVGYRLNPLYSDALATQVGHDAELPQVAELTAVNERLRQALNDWQRNGAELRNQNEALRITQQTLEQERERYQDRFESAPDGYLITDVRGVIQLANRKAATMLAMPAEALQDRPLLQFIHPDDRDSFRNHLAQNDWPPDWAVMLQPEHQAAFPVTLSVTSDCADDQDVAELRWLVRDIRDRQPLTEPLRTSHADLEQQVAERTATLHEQEAFLRSIYEGTVQGIFVVDVTPAGDFRYVSMNPAAIELSGLSLADIQHQTPEAAFGETVGSDLRQRYQDCVDAGHSIAYEEQFDLPHRSLWTVTTLAPLRDAAGRIYRLIGTVADISDRKHAELRLKSVSDALSNAVEGISQLDQHGHYTLVNDAYAQIVGYDRDDLVGRSWEVTVHPDDLDQVKSAFRTMLRHGKANIEARGLRRDGSVFYKQLTLVACYNKDAQYDGHYCFMKDVSDRKQLELSLQASQAQLSRIFDNAVAAISEFYAYPDRSYQHTFMSAGCQTVYGYSQQVMLQQGELWSSRVLPEDMEVVIKGAFERIFAEETFTIEYRFLDPDNQVRWIAETLLSRWDATHQRWMVTTVAINISDRKHAHTTLQQQIRQEYLLADMAQDIRKSLDLRDVLSRTVHRVRELLATDRVIIFQFRNDWQGDVIEESVAPNWIAIRATTIYDPCFEERYIEPYRQGRIAAITDIYQEDLEPCYLDLLQTFQVRANLAVPVLQGETLWGLLIAHHCSEPRQWQPGEIAMLRRLAVQVGIAIQQSELFEKTRYELTARRQMQAVLEESEQRFRTLSAAAPVGILHSNADGICLYTNQCWQTLSGLSATDSLGLGWQMAIHPSDRDRVQRRWQEFLNQHNTCQSEFRLLTTAGDIRWVSAQGALIRSATAEVIGHVCIMTDITAQKQATQTIEEQAALLDIAPDAIFTCDLDDRILYWNQGAETLYGWTAAEAQGQIAHDLLQEDPDQFATIVTTLLDQGEWQGEMPKVTKTGEQGIVKSHWTLVRDADNQPQYVLTVNTDITKQKQLEAQFYQAQKLETLGQLASGIAHDLNNVFTPILTLSQVLKLKHRDLDEQSQRLLEILENSARRGAGMVQQILSVTRRQQGPREWLNPVGILTEVIELAQESFPKSITWHYDVAAVDAENACQVWVDPAQLHQVLMNVIINARDAMPAGGTLTLHASVAWVDDAIAETTLDAEVGEYVLIAVTDTGQGIADEIRDRIFDPFFTTKEPGKGTGLGLSTALSVVREANGFLQVISETGSGTTVNIYLPRATDATPQPPADLDPPASSLPLPPTSSGDWVLVVDDDEIVQQATQSLLEGHHYTTLTAADGATAIALYQQHQAQIRLVVLDVTMPNMSGIELTERLHTINPSVRIIAISGLPANQTPALEAGAHRFLMKPYTPDTLLNAVKTLMQ